MVKHRSYCLFMVFFSCFGSLLYYKIFYLNRIIINTNISNNLAKYPFIALIVDDRMSEEVVRAIKNAIEHIPKDWKIQLVTPFDNWSFYNQSSLKPLITIGRVFLTPLDFHRLDFTGSEFINLLLTSAEFWRQVQGEKILLFQIDSVFCSNSSYDLNEFLDYDFIGAPWIDGKCCNGGLSIRSRNKLLAMYESGLTPYRLHSTNEDVWFARYLKQFSGRLAPADIAKKFSVESIYHPRPFAVHKPNIKNLGIDNLKLLCQNCPEVRQITRLC